MKSDHFHPWWHDGGYGNFTWVWLAAAAAERTKKMQFVTGVTAAVCRYNPGIIAQAFASLDVLHPGRISLGVGSGEAMNDLSSGYLLKFYRTNVSIFLSLAGEAQKLAALNVASQSGEHA